MPEGSSVLHQSPTKESPEGILQSAHSELASHTIRKEKNNLSLRILSLPVALIVLFDIRYLGYATIGPSINTYNSDRFNNPHTF